MILDVHTHLAGIPGMTPDDRMARLLEYADRFGVDRVCVYMGMAWTYTPKPDDLRRQNDQVLDALEHWSERAFGFVYLNPQYVDESLAELERCVAKGPMVGVKLWVARRCGDEQIDPIVKRAAELQAVVFQHTWWKAGDGNLPGESTPDDLARMAARHPNATIICGHTGGDWERGVRAIRPLPHVYADLAGGDPAAGFTEAAVRELGAERVLFGSDAPGRSFASQLAKVTGADITQDAKRLILGENLKRLLSPILTAKGVKL
jgi:predicted TIM-barrel fold metal-dependent hydrolase